MAGPLNYVELEKGASLLIREWVGKLCLDKVVCENIEDVNIFGRDHNIVRLVVLRGVDSKYFIGVEIGEESIGFYNDGERFSDPVAAVIQRRLVADEIKKGSEGSYCVRIGKDGLLDLKLA
jgi:hypothetical protein